MNALLIYNDQLLPNSIKNQFEEDNIGIAVNYKVLKSDLIEPNFNIDKHISNFLLEDEIELKKYDVIFLPYSLSTSNYSEYIGLRMAYHIRLTDEFVNLQTPIVFYGEEEPWELCKVTLNGQILFTQNISTTKKISVESFRKQLNYILEEFNQEKDDKEFLKGFVKRISILPPSSYNSHHSVNNESALLKWSEEIGCDKDIPEVKDNLQTGLYFKYLKALSKIKKTVDENLEDDDIEDDDIEDEDIEDEDIEAEDIEDEDIEAEQAEDNVDLTNEPKILLIDDEAEKGWSKFYERLLADIDLKLTTPKIKYKTDLSQIDVIKKAENAVKNFKKNPSLKDLPHIVLLDLRLHDSDFALALDPKNLTGYRILKRIKKINKGIQVIITTASNKTWNYQALMSGEHRADGYILKNGEDDPKQVLENIKKTIENASQRAGVLIKSFDLIQRLKKTEIDLKLPDSQSFQKSFQLNLNIAFKLLEESSLEDKYRNYCFLQLYQLLENYANLKEIYNFKTNELGNGFKCIIEVNGIKTWKLEHKKLPDYPVYIIKDKKSEKDVATFAKLAFVVAFLKNSDNNCLDSWGYLNNLRNKKVGHKGIEIVTYDDIFKMLYFCIFIFDKTEKSYAPPIDKNQLDELKKMLNSKRI